MPFDGFYFHFGAVAVVRMLCPPAVLPSPLSRPLAAIGSHQRNGELHLLARPKTTFYLRHSLLLAKLRPIILVVSFIARLSVHLSWTVQLGANWCYTWSDICIVTPSEASFKASPIKAITYLLWHSSFVSKPFDNKLSMFRTVPSD